MASQKQIAANRKNAAKSTGPRTPEGRLASSRNAIRHGLTARDLVVSVEDQLEFDDMLQAFEADLHPTGPLEEALFHQIVAAQWRLRRLRRIETGYFEIRLTTAASELEEDFSELEGAHKLALTLQDDCGGFKALPNLSRYESRIERSFYQALREFQRLQASRAAKPATPSAPTIEPPHMILPNEPNFIPTRLAGSGPGDVPSPEYDTIAAFRESPPCRP